MIQTEKMPYKLIPDRVSRNTVEALQTLLHGAENGEIIGLAYVAVLKQKRFVTDFAGYCYRDATHTRGMLRSLDDKLSDLANVRDPEETR
jgi:hypothetical protein